MFNTTYYFYFFAAVLSDNKWKPIREGFDFLYFIDNNIGGVNGVRLEKEDNEEDEDERDRLSLRTRTREENSAEERYDTIVDVNDDKREESEPRRKHDEF